MPRVRRAAAGAALSRGIFMRSILVGLGICAAFATASPLLAASKKSPASFVVVNEAVGVPVFPNDITDRPYKVVGEVKAGVRKATLFSSKASQEKIYKELWERAEKLGADAVINARYGDSRVTAMSWGQTDATGTAIKFVEPPAIPAAAPEAAAAPAGAAPAEPQDAANTPGLP